jgi:hypothetical protein
MPAPGTGGGVEQRIDDYINPAGFSLAPQGAFGNAPRTLGLHSAGGEELGLSIFKNFNITQSVKAQFRAESLNAFLHFLKDDLSSTIE